MLLRETMGVSVDGNSKALQSKDVINFMTQPKFVMPKLFENMHGYEYRPRVIVAIDPAGGGNSAFAITALFQYPSETNRKMEENGSTVVRAVFHSFTPPLPLPHFRP